MHARKGLVLVLVLILLVTTISVSAASLIDLAVNQHWKVQLLKGDEDGVRNLSTAFVGNLQVPMLSYSKVGQTRIYQAFAATSAVPGNCGPNNTWFCTSWNDSALVPNTVSNMATGLYGSSTFGVKWVYQAGGMLRGATVERLNDMSFVNDDWEDLIQLSKFGGTLVGTPSLQIVGGHYRLAVVIRSGGDFPTYKLVYMYYAGNFNNNSCRDGGFSYQCDEITTAIGYNSIGSPSLQVAPDGTVGIAYYYVNKLMYAYPHTDSMFVPSNCGPGPSYDTWRCITVYEGASTPVISQDVKLAFGATGSDRGIVFAYDNTMIEDTIWHAEYVGSGGNCGYDKNLLGLSVLKWKCTDIAILGDLAPSYNPSYSIAIDPQGYSVIAYNDDPEDLAPIFLYIAYPNARLGSAVPGWTAQKIDGPPVTEVATGAQAAISINSAGLGFIGYLQQEDYQLPDLKIAWQNFQIALPLVIR